MSLDLFFSLFLFTAILIHATVSFRETSWLPTWLGRGLSSNHPAVHARVALSNLMYAVSCILTAYLIRQTDFVWFGSMFWLVALYCAAIFFMRGYFSLRELRRR